MRENLRSASTQKITANFHSAWPIIDDRLMNLTVEHSPSSMDRSHFVGVVCIIGISDRIIGPPSPRSLDSFNKPIVEQHITNFSSQTTYPIQNDEGNNTRSNPIGS